MSGSIKPRRVFVVGDIHGGLRALQQVLSRCEYDSTQDKIIFLGDYSDGWSETAELIQYLIELQSSSKIGHVFLRGNHDAWVQEWLEYGTANKVWTMQGGQATIDSYIRTGYLDSNCGHLDFYRNLHNYYIDNDNNGFVHGGFHSKHGLGHEAYQSDYYWDRDLWNIALMSHNRFHEGGPDSFRRFEKHKEIFIGHTTTCNWNAKGHYPEWEQMGRKNIPITVPMNRCNVWNLDTGGGWEGKLTIMDINTKEYWQSDFVKDLYPEFKGR